MQNRAALAGPNLFASFPWGDTHGYSRLRHFVASVCAYDLLARLILPDADQCLGTGSGVRSSSVSSRKRSSVGFSLTAIRNSHAASTRRVKQRAFGSGSRVHHRHRAMIVFGRRGFLTTSPGHLRHPLRGAHHVGVVARLRPIQNLRAPLHAPARDGVGAGKIHLERIVETGLPINLLLQIARPPFALKKFLPSFSRLSKCFSNSSAAGERFVIWLASMAVFHAGRIVSRHKRRRPPNCPRRRGGLAGPFVSRIRGGGASAAWTISSRSLRVPLNSICFRSESTPGKFPQCVTPELLLAFFELVVRDLRRGAVHGAIVGRDRRARFAGQVRVIRQPLLDQV